MNLQNATPTEYVWKYNPNFGVPAGAQQNYGSTVNWVIPGGLPMAKTSEILRQKTLLPQFTKERTEIFLARSDQQDFANSHDQNYIASAAIDSGPSKANFYPYDSTHQIQLTGGMFIPYNFQEGEGQPQLTGGLNPISENLAVWAAVKGLKGRYPQVTSDSHKYFLRTDSPSAVIEEPGIYTQREFLLKFVPAAVKNPFSSLNSEGFPSQYHPLYKGRTGFEDVFWDW